MLGLIGGMLPSCASISLSDQIVPIDTEPRGLLVYRDRDSKKPLGRSPLLIRSAGQSTETVYVGMPSGRREAMSQECSVRWLPAVAGNAVFSALFGPVGVGVFGVTAAWDFLKTGKGFDCSEFDLKKFSVKGEHKNVDACLRYIVVPPSHFDGAFSDYIATQWMMRVSARSDECMRFADYNQAKEHFLYLNLDHQQEITVHKIGRQKSFELGQALRGSHFVFLKMQEDGGVVRVTPQVFDIVRQKAIADTEFQKNMTVDVPAVTKLKQVKSHRLLIQSFTLIPNSVTFSQNKFEMEMIEQSTYKQLGDAEEVRSLPTYLSNWGLTSIDHPRGYNIWDYAFQIYPSLHSSYQERNYKFETNELTKEVYRYNLKFMFLTTMFNAAATGHTPVGAFRISVGAGLAYINARDTFATTNQVAPLLGVNASYTAFLSQDVFFFSEVSNFSVQGGSKSAPIDNEFFRLMDWSVASVGLGYFVPTLRSYARGVID